MVKYTAVLFPTDFSEFSNVALVHAAYICRSCNARLIVLHVVEEVLLPDPIEYMGVYESINEIQKHIEEEAKKNLAILKKDSRLAGIEVSTDISNGKPFLEIVKYSRENKIDLIVMGTHGSSGLNHVLFGSTAEKVVRKAPCPVLTVKHPDHSFSMP
ncbi:MAG: universal stress protein [Candidatus Auribacterota bacterium]|jgi:nucleotide-binding universal stress UspA family protein|nr:universal stress protein [Candidatus Auribacterota bacterium]